MNPRYPIWVVFGIAAIFAISSVEAARYTIDFSAVPGPDGIPRTADDIPWGPHDINYVGDPPNGVTIAEQYASAGVHFSGSTSIGAYGGGFNPDGSPGPGFNLILDDIFIAGTPPHPSGWGTLSIHFDSPQTGVTLDLWDYIQYSGTGNPLTLLSGGQVIRSFTLTNADAILGGTNPGQLFGRFRLASTIPYDQIEFGLTEPSGGGFGIDNLSYDQVVPEPSGASAALMSAAAMLLLRCRKARSFSERENEHGVSCLR